MDVFIGDTMPVILEDSDPRHRLPAIKRPNRERQRDRQEHKKKGRGGVVVHLSGKSKQAHPETSEKPKLTY
ncbi:MAG: hypothetical protein GY697_26345 [Desulfobacterales bacterium]|nr:hypothetical protein [Desulfobacterales bacterium]